MTDERVVVVGAGEISSIWFGHLREEQVEVSAVVDIDIEAARKRIAEFELDAQASSDLAGVLEKFKPDFVLDLTVPEAHCETTCTALEMGFDVIGEKPMAASMAQAHKMLQTAERTGKMYMVSQSRRWTAEHDMQRRTIAAGDIGAVTTLNCDFYSGAHFGGFRAEMASPLILDMAIHHFDLARLLSGLDAVAVYAREHNPANSWYAGDAAASCVFEMTGGVVFTYRGSWCAEGCRTGWNGNWRIVGQEGTIIYEQDELLRGEVVAGDEGFHRPLRPVEMRPSDLQYREMHGALREMLAFLRTGRQPQTPCSDNIKSLAMVFAALESSQKGCRVKIEI